MAAKVLITGGAGFIGRHVAKALLDRSHDVVALDSLIDQVHTNGLAGMAQHEGVELVHGDIRDEDAVRRALRGATHVVHLAAEVGVGQSMYAVERYVSTNDVGTAILFQEIARAPVERVVVASSMSIYGEGLYSSASGTRHGDVVRAPLAGGPWDPPGPDGQPLIPIPTPESKTPSLASVYALSKYVQERMTLMLTEAYGIEGCALRLFNVYGPGQALSNPYTGVLAIFASRLHNHKPPCVFEDGLQRRDFVHVDDVAAAFVAALEKPEAAGGVFNIGSGRNWTIREVARLLADAMGRPHVTAEIIGKARAGDIRHCFADITLARERLDYEPRRRLETSLGELADWVREQKAIDRVAEARAELETRGLVL